jgi:6-pyruvoyltetrahydropterin/6-carboxytetrahydropterin synthase
MAQQVVLGRRAMFSAGLELKRADWSAERNRAVYGRDVLPHGHDYIITVYYAGTPRVEDGMIVNLNDIKPILKRVLQPFDHAFLNDLPAFAHAPPTLENLVQFLWREIPARLEDARLVRLCLQESPRVWIELNQNSADNSMKLTRKYEFAAAHRLHAPMLSAEENTARYGKCNNPRGHGHNYGLEVTVEGTPDAASGVLIAPHEMDALVEAEIFGRFDHKHLNEDCPEFENLIPTSENLARVIFDLLAPKIETASRKLAKIGLHETQKNYFEVEAA